MPVSKEEINQLVADSLHINRLPNTFAMATIKRFFTYFQINNGIRSVAFTRKQNKIAMQISSIQPGYGKTVPVA